MFNTPDYEKGLSYVQTGRNLAVIEQDEHRRFVFKVCLAKNIFKFTDEQKHSVNTLANFEKAKPNVKYGLCIMSQIPKITLRLVSVSAKWSNYYIWDPFLLLIHNIFLLSTNIIIYTQSSDKEMESTFILLLRREN